MDPFLSYVLEEFSCIYLKGFVIVTISTISGQLYIDKHVCMKCAMKRLIRAAVWPLVIPYIIEELFHYITNEE